MHLEQGEAALRILKTGSVASWYQPDYRHQKEGLVRRARSGGLGFQVLLAREIRKSAKAKTMTSCGPTEIWRWRWGRPRISHPGPRRPRILILAKRRYRWNSPWSNGERAFRRLIILFMVLISRNQKFTKIKLRVSRDEYRPVLPKFILGLVVSAINNGGHDFSGDALKQGDGCRNSGGHNNRERSG